MKKRKDCKCSCHTGGIVLHVVPCCDGSPGYAAAKWLRSRKKKATSNKRKKKRA